jgi:hypothetical protein
MILLQQLTWSIIDRRPVPPPGPGGSGRPKTISGLGAIPLTLTLLSLVSRSGKTAKILAEAPSCRRPKRQVVDNNNKYQLRPLMTRSIRGGVWPRQGQGVGQTDELVHRTESSKPPPSPSSGCNYVNRTQQESLPHCQTTLGWRLRLSSNRIAGSAGPQRIVGIAIAQKE